MIQNRRRLFGRSCSGHLEIILAVVIAVMGVVWFWKSSSSKKQYSAVSSGYYVAPQYSRAGEESLAVSSEYSGGINTKLLWMAGGLIYVVGVMTGLFFPLLHALKHKHHKVPFSFSSFLPTRANRAMGFLDGLQKMREAGLITKHEFESKRLEFLAKL